MKKIIMIIMAAAFVLPTMAQTMQFQSTSSMRGSGKYVAPVTAVGATSAASTYSPAKAPGMKRGYDANGNWTPDSDDFGGGAESGASEQFPLGDAVMPLALMALTFAGVIYFRKRKARV